MTIYIEGEISGVATSLEPEVAMKKIVELDAQIREHEREKRARELEAHECGRRIVEIKKTRAKIVAGVAIFLGLPLREEPKTAGEA